MLWIIVLILVLLWALGMVAFPSVGMLLHLLLVVAVIVVIVQLVQWLINRTPPSNPL